MRKSKKNPKDPADLETEMTDKDVASATTTPADDGSTQKESTDKEPKDDKSDKKPAKGGGETYESGDSRRKTLAPLSHGEIHQGIRAALISAFINHQEDLEVTVPVNVIGETYLYNFTRVIDDFTNGQNLSVSAQSIEALAKNIMEFQKVLGLMYHVGVDEDKHGKKFGTERTLVDSAGHSVTISNWLTSEPLAPGRWYDPDSGKEILVTGEELERITAPLREANMSDDQINALIRLAVQQLDRTIVRNSFVPTALRHSLETKMFAFENFDDEDQFSRANLRSTIRSIQNLYARACLQLSLDVFSQELTDTIANDKRLKFATNMNRFFREASEPTMPVRFSAIMEEIAPALGQERIMTGHSACGGLCYFVDEITSDFDLDEVPRAVWIEFVFNLIKDYTTLDSRPELWNPERLLEHELALNPRSSSWQLGLPPDILAARPTKSEAFWTQEELADGFAKMEKLFKRVYLRAFMKVVSTRQEGVLTGRLLSVLDERAITRSETWDYVVTNGIRALSCVHQAYLDCFMFFYEIAMNQDILMKDDDHHYTPMLIEYFDRQIQIFKRTYTPMNEAAHLKEASILFLGLNPVPVIGEFHYAYTDEILLDYDDTNLDIFSSKYRYLYANTRISGDPLGVPAKLSDFEKRAYQWPEYSPILKPLQVKYFMIRSIDLSQGGTDLIEALLRYQDVRELYRYGLGRWFQDKCEANVYLDADDMARDLQIPLPVAEVLFQGASAAPLSYKIVFRYTGALQQYIFFDPKLCPIYELGERRDDDPRFYKRFKAMWPALVSGSADPITKPIYNMGL